MTSEYFKTKYTKLIKCKKKYYAIFKVGCQQFSLSLPFSMEKEEAEFMRDMFSKALLKVVKNEMRKED